MATKLRVAGMTLAALVLAAMPVMADAIAPGEQVIVKGVAGVNSRFHYTGVGTGGAFNLYKWNGATNTATLMDFETFCLEVTEGIGSSSDSIPPEHIYNVAGVTNSAIAGGADCQATPGCSSDPLSVEAKWVYYQYSLAKPVGWTGALVQEVIWLLEGERVTDVSPQALAIKALAPSSFDFGNWSVQVLNLRTLAGESAQDLVYMQPVPEPASLVLLGSGLLGLAAWRRKRQ